MKIKFRTKYERRNIKTSFKGVKSLVDRQYLGDTTIDGIVRRYGILPPPEVKPFNADVSEYGDFAENLNRINDGLERFASLPSEIRQRFGNDPKAFYNWIVNPENLKEAVKLGLAEEHKVTPDTTELLEEIRDNTKKVSPDGQN